MARQMSGPVPSPSMKGMIGLSGTLSLPLAIVIVCAAGGRLEAGFRHGFLREFEARGRDGRARGALLSRFRGAR